MGRGVDWAAQDVAQLRQWLEEERKPREMRALRPESINTKIKHLRRGAPDESRPLKRPRTTEVLAEIEGGRDRDAGACSVGNCAP